MTCLLNRSILNGLVMHQPSTHCRLRKIYLMCAESCCTLDVFTSGSPSQKPWSLASHFTYALAVLVSSRPQVQAPPTQDSSRHGRARVLVAIHNRWQANTQRR